MVKEIDTTGEIEIGEVLNPWQCYLLFSLFQWKLLLKMNVSLTWHNAPFDRHRIKIGKKNLNTNNALPSSVFFTAKKTKYQILLKPKYCQNNNEIKEVIW